MTDSEFKSKWDALTKEEERRIIEFALSLASPEIEYFKRHMEEEEKQNGEE